MVSQVNLARTDTELKWQHGFRIHRPLLPLDAGYLQKQYNNNIVFDIICTEKLSCCDLKKVIIAPGIAAPDVNKTKKPARHLSTLVIIT